MSNRRFVTTTVIVLTGFIGAIISAPLFLLALVTQMLGTGEHIYAEIGVLFLALIASCGLILFGVKRGRQDRDKPSDPIPQGNGSA